MIAVDTNVLVRVLVDDAEQRAQTAAARKKMRAAKQIFVPQIVQVECVWVFETAYRMHKDAVIGILSHLCNNSAFVLQHPETFMTALQWFQQNNANFADCLILAESRGAGCELFTFDKRLGKQHGARLLTS
ncbi:MAG TPA: type II toxin-antitoxin system VapC family toxin [Gammaproteobacteria bacterium]|nr:type II toxin-antitoxin system VapC family toxin [Gammaproteobacteria bacterium]